MVIQDVMTMEVHIHHKSHLTKFRKQTAYCNVSTRRGEVRMCLIFIYFSSINVDLLEAERSCHHITNEHSGSPS